MWSSLNAKSGLHALQGLRDEQRAPHYGRKVEFFAMLMLLMQYEHTLEGITDNAPAVWRGIRVIIIDYTEKSQTCCEVGQLGVD